MLNPDQPCAARRRTPQRYKVEPYVVAADVYSVAPHVGRGGWTWYTGAAGWMYRAGIEGILGIRREGSFLVDRPLHSAGVAGLRGQAEGGRYPLRHPGVLHRRNAAKVFRARCSMAQLGPFAENRCACRWTAQVTSCNS